MWCTDTSGAGTECHSCILLWMMHIIIMVDYTACTDSQAGSDTSKKHSKYGEKWVQKTEWVKIPGGVFSLI